MTKLEELKSMCDLILEEKSHMDKRFKILSDELTVSLRNQFLHRSNEDYNTYLHVREIVADYDHIEIKGVVLESNTDETEPSIWDCISYISYDELFNEWELIDKETFIAAWIHMIDLLVATLPSNFLQINDKTSES